MNTKLNEEARKLADNGTSKLNAIDFNKRFYEHDATLWKTEKEHTDLIANCLGWTEVYNWTLDRIDEIETFAKEVKDNFDYVVLMGMGGSSLAPEVLRVVFGKQESWPELLVLDTTNPDWVGKVRAKINIEKTLFIFASKSGGTVEPSSQFAYFYDEVSKVKENAGSNFIAITDPNTNLQKLAEEKHFRKVFVNKADIGGRFSALSFFGMVPASLAGLNVRKILEVAKMVGEKYKICPHNPAIKLGCVMGEGFLKGLNKLTLIAPNQIDIFGLWVEQLVAESTGKENKGILPVVRETIQKEDIYDKDRIFVKINYSEKETDFSVKSAPLFSVDLENNYQIGAHFLMWEIATATCAIFMKINPFDQPNVQLAKTITKNLLASLEKGEKSNETTAPFITSKDLTNKICKDNLVADIIKIAKDKSYIALLAYLNETDELNKMFKSLQEKIFNETHKAVVFGYGPRYLHSTGQLHKGDEGKGLFVIFSGDTKQDIKIPNQTFSFQDLVTSQALADFKALEEKGRSAIKIHLIGETEQALNKIK